MVNYYLKDINLQSQTEKLTDTQEPSSLGRYVIRGEIGRGNMGVVYRGYDPVIDRLVALKTVILPKSLTAESHNRFLERFLREARIAGKLLHPNIVVTYDAATDEETGVPFIVMELVEGEPLSTQLMQRGSLPWKEALDLAVPLAQALDYAHDNGVVHRDIKPANVILTPKGVPKIADFGIAKLPATDHTQTGTILGTPYFMSPEQLMGKKLDGRSDIFSLGVLLYSVVAGRQPFDGSDIPSIVSQVLYKNPRPISELVPHVPTAFDGVLARAMDKDKDRRYGTSEELADDLLTVKRGEAPSQAPSIGEATTAVAGDASPEKSEQLEPPAERTIPLWERYRHRLAQMSPKARLALTASVAIVAVALLVFVIGGIGLGPNLPLESAATHHHLIGGCSGRLTLQDWGVEYKSREHGTWQWEWDQIRRMERRGTRRLTILTRENELLGLVKSKPYNFTLTEIELEDDFWSAYQAIALGDDPPTRTESREDPTPTDDKEPTDVNSTEADLFYAATVAFENGELEESQKKLEELLQREPEFAGAEQLLADVDVQLWKQTLPLSFTARHNHRIGHCVGKLSLEDWGIEYRSKDHGVWQWRFSQIRMMERPGSWRLEIETRETELLAMGKPKSYKFMFMDLPLEDQTWRRYRRLADRSRSK